MNDAKGNASRTLRLSALALLGCTTLLGGCYVIPVHPTPVLGPVIVVPAPDLHIIARLYPANDEANATGVLQGLVTNRLNGKGYFTLVAHGEQMSGEATRYANSKHGIANATGARGGYVQCTYEMTTPAQGSGDCRFSNGARYTLHLGG